MTQFIISRSTRDDVPRIFDGCQAVKGIFDEAYGVSFGGTCGLLCVRASNIAVRATRRRDHDWIARVLMDCRFVSGRLLLVFKRTLML